MNIVIRNAANGRETLYTQRNLLTEARQTAEARGERYVRHWVAFHSSGAAVLRVETKRHDGLGDIVDIGI